MIIKKETDLWQFEAWCEAKNTLDFLVDHSDDEPIQQLIEEIYPEGIDETDLNDFLWFEKDQIASEFGFDSWDEYVEDREKPEE